MRLRASKLTKGAAEHAADTADVPPMATVEVYTDRELLRMHGPTGGLILRLQRQSLIGYLFGLVAMVMFGGYVMLNHFAPTTLALDEENRVIGTINYRGANVLRDIEYIYGAQTFLRGYMSSDSHDIYEDYNRALSMMDEPLREARMGELKASNMKYLADIAESGVYGRVEFEKDDVRVIARHGDAVLVRARGTVVAQAPGGEAIRRVFDITLTTHAVARTNANITGIMISKLERN